MKEQTRREKCSTLRYVLRRLNYFLLCAEDDREKPGDKYEAVELAEGLAEGVNDLWPEVNGKEKSHD